MLGIERLRHWLADLAGTVDGAVSALCILLLVFVVGANGAEMLLRNVFSQSIQWLYEGNLLIANWLYFLGMTLVYYRNKDITLDFMLLIVKGRVRRIYLIAVNLIGIATFVVIADWAGALIRLQLPFRTPGYGIPEPLYTLPVWLSALIIALHLARQSLEIWCGENVPRGAGAHSE